MSSPAPTSPARRPGPPSKPLAGATTVVRSGPTPEEVAALPDFADDGVDVNYDPSTAAIGFLGSSSQGEAAEIVAAKFQKSNYTNQPANMQNAVLQIDFKRLQTGKVSFQSYAYGYWSTYAPTKDGNQIKARKSFVDAKGFVPRPNSDQPFVIFMQSLKDAAGQELIERINKEGAKALVGLRVHVRERTIEGRTKKMLLVDHVLDGAGSASPVNPSTASAGKVVAKSAEKPTLAQVETKVTAPKVDATKVVDAPTQQETVVDTDIEALAEAALLDILTAADGNAVTRNLIPSKIIQIAKWRDHDSRGQILATIRDTKFITKDGAPWSVDGNTVKLG